MVERQTVTIKKSEVTPSEASKSFFESKFKNLKWKKGGDEDYPSVVAHKKFRGVPIDIEIEEDGQGEIIIGDADEEIGRASCRERV